MRLTVTDRDDAGRWSRSRTVSTDPFRLEDYPFEGPLTRRALNVRIKAAVNELRVAKGLAPLPDVRPRKPPTWKRPEPERDVYDAYPDHTSPINSFRRNRFGGGQAIAEVALVLPVLLFVFLGFIEVGRLYAFQHGYQNGVDVLAQLAASDPDWRSKVPSEDDRTSCHGNPPDARYPDDDESSGDRVVVTWTCRYSPLVLSQLAVPVTVQSEAMIR